MSYPKIELHVHLEGTVRPAALLRFARHNGLALPADSADELARIYDFRDFRHFLDVWWMTTGALRTESDFRRVVVDYAAEAASHGAVYLEAIFSPSEPASRGVSYEEVFAGYCDGAQEAWESYERVFAQARDGGLGSVPHAGEADGPASVRGALDILGAGRIRHGIRATEDPGLLRDLADRGIVLDVCPISNVRTGVVRSLAQHPLPGLLAAGVQCTINTDDPAMFGSDLGTEYATALGLGRRPSSATPWV